MKVWALFSINLQEYDQPENDLEALFLNKPSPNQLSKAIYGGPLAELGHDDLILWIASLYENEEVTIQGRAEYRLEEVEVLE